MPSSKTSTDTSLRYWIRVRYEDSLNPELWKVHLYLGLGFGGAILVALFPSPPAGLIFGMISASTIFAFHEYLGYQIHELVDLLSDKYRLLSLLDSSPFLSGGLVIIIDVIIAVPMFASSDYSNFMGPFLILFFSCLWMAKEGRKFPKDLYRSLSGLSVYKLAAWIVIFLVALLYLLVNLTNFQILVDYMNSSDPVPLSPQSTILTMSSVLIVGVVYMAVMYATIVPLTAVMLFLIWVLLPPYALLFPNPGLLGEGIAEMSLTLRIWAFISMMIIYAVFSIPAFIRRTKTEG